tara:strand:+ start:172 stop:936 length:765 start_codon:yes stop_codon:yes gene_type:complete
LGAGFLLEEKEITLVRALIFIGATSVSRFGIREFISPKLWVALVLCGAFFVIAIGIWGESLVGGDVGPVSNAIRGFHWETLAAGLFGLAGGLFVIVATRNQMAQSERIAIQQHRDFLLSDINAEMGDLGDFCVTCQEFIDRAQRLSGLAEHGRTEDYIAERVSVSLDAKDESYLLIKYIDIAEELRSNGRVPAVAVEAFHDVTESLKGLLGALRTVSVGEKDLISWMYRLDYSTGVLREALKLHKLRILEVREI